MGFGVWGLGFEVWGLRFGVRGWGLGLRLALQLTLLAPADAHGKSAPTCSSD